MHGPNGLSINLVALEKSAKREALKKTLIQSSLVMGVLTLLGLCVYGFSQIYY